jgi:hypothetical protein
MYFRVGKFSYPKTTNLLCANALSDMAFRQSVLFRKPAADRLVVEFETEVGERDA